MVVVTRAFFTGFSHAAFRVILKLCNIRAVAMIILH